MTSRTPHLHGLPILVGNPMIHLAAEGAPAPEVSERERTITGLAVPFGKAAEVGWWGPLTFDASSLSWAGDISRVKLLEQHDHDRSHGVATQLTQDSTGLWATFTVAAGAEGDRLLDEIGDGRRDGLSVGVQLDEDFLDRWWAALMNDETGPILASGALREVSAVSIPAYDDARIERKPS